MALKFFEFPSEAPWLSNAPPPLDNAAALPVWGGTSTDQADPFSLPTAVGETAQPIPLHSSQTSSLDTSDSSTIFAINLLKPRPTPTHGSTVILPRIETNVSLDITLPSGSWNAIQLPLTQSVTCDQSSSIDEGFKPLLLVIIVRGATTRQDCNFVCEQCEKRTGNKIGPPSLIDFHSPSNIITPKGGTIQVHFTFSCYSRHHRKEDEQYVLEVILKDASNPFGPIEGPRKELPYSFDVRSSIPRTKGPTGCHTHQANIGTSCSISRGKHPATIHSDDSTFGIDALCISPAPDASAQPRNRGRGCPPLIGPLIFHPRCEWDTEKVRAQARIAEREVQINALEMKIRDLKATFEADSQEKYAAIKDHFKNRVLAIQEEFVDSLNGVPS